jgi:hypothetical protein
MFGVNFLLIPKTNPDYPFNYARRTITYREVFL